MTTFRLAVVDSCRQTKCIELQKLVKNELGNEEWVHYCILKHERQALEVIAEKEPNLLSIAQKDLHKAKIMDSKNDRSLEVRVAKHIRGW